MTEQRILFVELDCPKCANTYGVSPCAATDPEQCKNTAATCKDIANYDGSEIQTLRWIKAASYAKSITAVPNLSSVTTSSQRINPAENLGKRERVTCSFFNHRHNDNDLDPYAHLRPYIPYEQGTYWGKFAAMYPNVQGYPMRVWQAASDLSDYTVSNYVADVGQVLGDKTGYSLTGKDVLDFAEGNKTLCPTPSNGILSAAITSSSTSLTLSPAGIGAEYPTAFEAYIGDEWVSCTRVGDVVTLVQRGMFGTVANAHEKDDTLQVAEVFLSKNVSQILERLLSYTNTPAEYYNQAQWDQQVALVNSPFLTARIGNPTPVFELIQDFMRDMALDIHTDVIAKKIVMYFLINQVPVMEINDQNIIDTPQAKFYDDKRCDLFLFSFSRRNPLLKMDEPSNYSATIVRPSNNQVVASLGNPPAIRRHYSRWVSGLLRPQASQSTEFFVGRYEFAPRGLMCKMKTDMAPQLAQVVTVKTSVFEDAYGRTPSIPMQVVSCSRGQAHAMLELEEFRVAPFQPDALTIIVSLTDDMLNMGGFATLRDMYNSIYPAAIPVGATVRFVASSGVVFGASSGSPAGGFSVVLGDWPEATDGDAFIVIDGLYIAGRGGRGGYKDGTFVQVDGENGSNALYTRVPITLHDCVVAGGGGGGGIARLSSTYGGGGGGAGREFGLGGTIDPRTTLFDGENGTLTDGGDGNEFFFGGVNRGGDRGQPGVGFSNSYVTSAGGAAGLAVDGDSYLTITGSTVFYGARIN